MGGDDINKLKDLREQKGFTQDYMAKSIGVQSKNAYSLKERGERKFTIEEAFIIAKVFEMSIEEIFFDKGVTNSVSYLETG